MSLPGVSGATPGDQRGFACGRQGASDSLVLGLCLCKQPTGAIQRSGLSEGFELPTQLRKSLRAKLGAIRLQAVRREPHSGHVAGIQRVL